MPDNSALISQLAPLQDYIEYETRPVDIAGVRDHDKYGGPPTMEQNRAWDHLMQGKRYYMLVLDHILMFAGAFFNATIPEFTRAGESLENLTELTEGGYLASIGVYHELHCLVRLS